MKPRRLRARPRPLTRRLAAAAGVLGVTVAGLASVVAQPTASAAVPRPGQVVVGASPVGLTQPSDNLLGRMTPSPTADTQGMFAPQVAWPVIPLHVALGANGHLVSYGTPLNVAVQGGFVYDDWDPTYGTVAEAHQLTPSMATYNSFCNSLAFLPDGRLFMVGGNGFLVTSNQSMFFDPATGAEAMGPVLGRQRWYSTVLHRPDDRYVDMGGADFYASAGYKTPDDTSKIGITPEISDAGGPWSSLSGATSTTAFGPASNHYWYPRAFNAPDGSVFGISGTQLWRMTTDGAGSIADVGTLPVTPGVSGSTVMYAPGKILIAGGGELANATTTSATRAAEVIDITGPRPVVRPTGSLAAPRQWLNATVLPTGEVLANGGTVVGTDGGAANSSYTTEMWDPATGQWRTGASATRIRTYHSTSLLMPSGAVFTGGGGVPGPEDNFNSETYYPPYLFTRDAAGASPAMRPGRWCGRTAPRSPPSRGTSRGEARSRSARVTPATSRRCR